MNQSTVDNWIVELEKERKPKTSLDCTPEEKEKIIQFVHRFQTENDAGVIGFSRLAAIIREHKKDFGGYHPGKTTLQQWHKEWLKHQ